jgi:hypothetical protein
LSNDERLIIFLLSNFIDINTFISGYERPTDLLASALMVEIRR